MNARLWSTAVFLLALVVTACVPAETEPGVLEVSRPASPSASPTPPPLPTPAPPADPGGPPAPPPGPAALPWPPEQAPATLPVYAMAPEPVPATGEAALEWARSFGLADAAVVEQTAEMVRLLSQDGAGGFEELTFLSTPTEPAIVYSRGAAGSVAGGPTPLPTAAADTPAPLLPDTVTGAALEFVRAHALLPDPLVAHEFPSGDDRYLVQVTAALSGLRLTGITALPGATVWVDGQGRVTEARLVPARFAAAETVNVAPLSQVYPAFTRGAVSTIYYYERARLYAPFPLDPMRFQAHSTPYGGQNDRVELVYAPLPLQPARLVPMWLITRPHDQAWDHYVELYLPAAGGTDPPRPRPTRTPLAQTGIVPETLRIVPPLLVDSEHGRLYTNAAVNGITHTVSLDAVTGELAAVFGLTGDLAADGPFHHHRDRVRGSDGSAAGH